MPPALALLALGACSLLKPTATAPPPAFYSLDAPPAPAGAAWPSGPGRRATLIVNPPHAAAGFDSQRIIYVRETHKLEYFAHSEWVDPPARMLAPLLVAAVENTGAFRAVVLTPSAAAGELRLDTEIIRLQQEFQTQPSRVRFTLRAYLVDNRTRRVLAWREFESRRPRRQRGSLWRRGGGQPRGAGRAARSIPVFIRKTSMNTSKLIGIILIVLGGLGLAYGGFSYTKETTGVKLGPLELKVQERERVNIPVIASAGAIAAGVLLLALGRK